MKFLKRKNLADLEQVLYVPVLHWMFVVKHVIRTFLAIFVIISVWFIFSMEKNFDEFMKEFFNLQNFTINNYFFEIVIIWFAIFICQMVYYIFKYQLIKYKVTNKRLIIKKGFFSTEIIEFPLDRIESIYCRQSLSGLLFNYANVVINGVGGKSMVYYMVYKPFALRRRVIEIIEKNKLITVIHGDVPVSVNPDCKIIDKKYLCGNFVKMS